MCHVVQCEPLHVGSLRDQTCFISFPRAFHLPWVFYHPQKSDTDLLDSIHIHSIFVNCWISLVSNLINLLLYEMNVDFKWPAKIPSRLLSDRWLVHMISSMFWLVRLYISVESMKKHPDTVPVVRPESQQSWFQHTPGFLASAVSLTTASPAKESVRLPARFQRQVGLGPLELLKTTQNPTVSSPTLQ